MEQEAVARLEPKTAQQAIIGRIAEDLRLTPFLARAYYEQMAEYFRLFAGLDLQDNQLAYCAVGAQEPPGKRITDCARVSVRLTLHAAADFDNTGSTSVPELRRRRLRRLCEEALDQGGLLSQEDLALILTTSESTIKRDLRALRAAGISVPTRGQQRDIGPGVSHKVQTVLGYLRGEDFTQLSRRLCHGQDSMERYLKAFRQVALMTQEGLAPELICRACRLSAALVAQYQALYQQALGDAAMQSRLRDLLGTDAPPAGKGGIGG
jgi:biotin operon repressor